MTELKPCPFCGGEAHIVSDYNSEQGKTRWNLWHECSGHEGRSEGYGHALRPWFETPWYDTEAEAAEAWNSRVDDRREAADYWKRMYEETVRERTCRNKAKSPSTFWCSECDCAVEDWTDVGGTLMSVSYCPNCGAKVVEL